MKQRVISALVMAAIVAVCIPFLYSRVLLFGVIGVISAYELCINFDRQLNIKVAAWVLYVYLAVQVFLAITNCGIMAYFAWYAFAVCLALFSGILRKDIKGLGAVYTLAALSYPAFPAAMCIFISVSSRWIQTYALAFLAPVVCDTFALLGGMKFGKHKLAPEVSPSKTIEGSIIGGIMSILAGVVVWFVSRWFLPIPFIPCIVTAFVASTAGQIGDLAESLLKRYLGVKDTSHLIPGHGGMLDRVDSLLFAAPAAYFCLYAFGL
ncbi:MAG: phosphatidate cytidylyltransferase [Eubacteriales bacterium]|nr:phosphatidate cytidylyltransferase [Eubacteriales bacterium]